LIRSAAEQNLGRETTRGVAMKGWIAWLPLLVPFLLFMAEGCGKELSPEEEAAKGLAWDMPPDAGTMPAAAMLVASSTNPVGPVELFERHALVPRERLVLSLLLTDGMDLTSQAIFTSSQPKAATVEGNWLTGVTDGITRVCGESGKYRACEDFPVAAYVTAEFSGQDQVQYWQIRSVDGFEAVGENGYPLYLMMGTLYTDTQFAGRFGVDFIGGAVYDFRDGAVVTLPDWFPASPTDDLRPYMVNDRLLVVYNNEWKGVFEWGFAQQPGQAATGPFDVPIPPGISTIPWDVHLLLPDDGSFGVYVALDADGKAVNIYTPFPLGPAVVLPDAFVKTLPTVAPASGMFAVIAGETQQPSYLRVYQGGDKTPELLFEKEVLPFPVDAFGISFSPDESRILVRFSLCYGDDDGFCGQEWLVDIATGEETYVPANAQFGPAGTLLFPAENGILWEFDPETGEFGETRVGTGRLPLHPSGELSPCGAIDLPVGVPSGVCSSQDGGLEQVFLRWLPVSEWSSPGLPEVPEDPGRIVVAPYGATGDPTIIPGSMSSTSLVVARPDGKAPRLVDAGNESIVRYILADNGQIFLRTGIGRILVTDSTGSVQHTLAANTKDLLAASPDGRRIAYASGGKWDEHRVRFLDATTGDLLFDAEEMLYVCIPPGDAPAFAVTASGQAVRIDTTTGDVKPLCGLTEQLGVGAPKGLVEPMDRISCSLDVRRVAYVDESRRVFLLDGETGVSQQVAGSNDMEVLRVGLSGDGNTLAATISGMKVNDIGSEVGRIELWVGEAPGFKLGRRLEYVSSVGQHTYHLTKPYVSKGGAQVALLYIDQLTDLTVGEGGQMLVIKMNSFLLMYDEGARNVTNLFEVSNGHPALR